MREVARLHIQTLPHTTSSKRGVDYVAGLYKIVERVGYVKTIKREEKIVGVISGIGALILTLVVDPKWQKKGIGRELIAGLVGKQYVYTEGVSSGFYEKMGFSRILQLGRTIFLCRK